MNKKTLSFLFLSIVAAFSTTAKADESSVRAAMTAKYPATQVKSVEKSPIPGVYQVVMGKNIAYVSEDGRYFLFGSLYDMQTQTDLTANVKAMASRVDVSTIDLTKAIKTVKGKGTRSLIVFTDPDCPYCKTLAKTIDGMQDITVYNVLYPIAGLHPEAVKKSEFVFCSPENGKVLDDWFVRGIPIKASKPCANPIENNIALAQKLGINGTPTLVSLDGRVMPGAGSKVAIEEFLVAR